MGPSAGMTNGVNGQLSGASGPGASQQQQSGQQNGAGTDADLSARFGGFTGAGGVDLAQGKSDFPLHQDDYSNLTGFKRGFPPKRDRWRTSFIVRKICLAVSLIFFFSIFMNRVKQEV
jgi:hypothetical protein